MAFDADAFLEEISRGGRDTGLSGGQKLGLLGSGVASVFAKSTRPTQGFLSSMEMLQQQKEAQHQANLATFRAQMDAAAHESRMRANELDFSIKTKNQELREKNQDILLKKAESDIGTFFDAQKHDLEMGQKGREGLLKLVDQFTGTVQKFGLGEVTKPISETVTKKVTEKKEAVSEEISDIEQKREADVAFAALSPAALKATKEELGIRSPEAQAAIDAKAEKAFFDLEKVKQDVLDSITDRTNKNLVGQLISGQIKPADIPKENAEVFEKYAEYLTGQARTQSLIGASEASAFAATQLGLERREKRERDRIEGEKEAAGKPFTFETLYGLDEKPLAQGTRRAVFFDPLDGAASTVQELPNGQFDVTNFVDHLRREVTLHPELTPDNLSRIMFTESAKANRQIDNKGMWELMRAEGFLEENNIIDSFATFTPLEGEKTQSEFISDFAISQGYFQSGGLWIKKNPGYRAFLDNPSGLMKEVYK